MRGKSTTSQYILISQRILDVGAEYAINLSTLYHNVPYLWLAKKKAMGKKDFVFLAKKQKKKYYSVDMKKIGEDLMNK